MIHLRIEDTFHCGAEAFWQYFFDPELNAQIYEQDLDFPRFVLREQTDDGKLIRRAFEVTPRLRASLALRLLLAPAARYVEAGEYDRTSERYQYTVTPSAFAARVRHSGSVRVIAGGRSVTRIAEVTIDAAFGPLTRAIEGAVARTTEFGYRCFAAGVNRRQLNSRSTDLTSIGKDTQSTYVDHDAGGANTYCELEKRGVV